MIQSVIEGKKSGDKYVCIRYSPTSITIGNAKIPFIHSVVNLSFTLDCHPSMNALVYNIARTCFFELHRLASIRRFLTNTATATLVSALFCQ